jgi:hypothetical protein
MPGIGAIPPSMQPTKITSQQVNAWRIQFIETILQTVVQAITGTFLPGGGSAFTQLISVFGSLFGAAGGATGLGQFTNFFTNLLSIFGVSGTALTGAPGAFNPTSVLGSLGSIPILGPIFSLFGGATTSTQAGNFFTNLLSMFNTPTLTGSPGSFNPTTVLYDWITILVQPLGLLLGPTSPLNALNLFGLLPTNLFGLLPLSSLGSVSPNLLANPTFDTAASMLGETVWSWDGTQTHTGTGGSALATADGSNKNLLSNAISVVADQQLPMSVWTKWSGLTSTGSPISLGITAFLNGTQVASSTLASIASPGASGGWQQLTATYTVPAGVDAVRMQTHVDATATAGSVWFDDGSITKTLGQNVVPQSFVTGLPQQFLDIFAVFGGAGAGLTQLTNAWTNLLQLFNIGSLGTLTGSPGSFNPATILTSMITGLINPLNLLAPLSGGFLSLGNIPTLTDAKVPGVGTIVDNIVGQLTGLIGSGFPQSAAASALGGTTSAIAANSAAITRIEGAATAAANSGISALEPFEYVNATSLDPTQWSTTYLEGGSAGGFLAVADGHNAGLVAGNGSNTTHMARFVGTGQYSLTDYQQKTVVVATTMADPGWWGSGQAAIDVYGRTNDAQTQWVRARFQNNGQVLIQYQNGGAVTQLGSTGSISNPPVGTKLTLEAGTSGGARIYRALYNGAVVASGTDAGTATAVGATNRGWGWGQRYAGNSPGKVTQWSATDNAPVAVQGTTMRVYRAATSGVNKTAGDNILGANTFDTVDWITPDLTWDASTSTLTVGKAATYLFSARIQVASTLTWSEAWAPLLYVGGVLKARMGARAGITAAAFGAPSFPTDKAVGGDSPLWYCPAGTTIQLGMAGNAESVVGDAGGTITWFTAAKLG